MANEKRELAEQIALFAWRARFVHVYPKLRWLHSSLNGAYLTGKEIADQSESGKTAGIPDVFLPVREKCIAGTYIAGLYIEMKIKGNGLTMEQSEFFTDARAEGYRCEIAYSWIEAVNVIMDYLGIDDARLRDELRMSTPGVKPKVRKVKPAHKPSMTGSCDAGLMMERQRLHDEPIP